MNHLKMLAHGTVLGLFLSLPLSAAEYTVGDLLIKDPYTRSTPPGAPVAGGFLSITNNGQEADTLIGGKVGFAETVEVHEMPMIDGVMKMRQLPEGLDIPPGATVELKPGGYHLMFIKLSSALKAGDTQAATLNFAKAGAVEIELPVKDVTALQGQGNGHGMQHGGDSQGHDMHRQHGKQGTPAPRHAGHVARQSDAQPDARCHATR
ncbi:MAG: copper chaperone PCu(A)C [Thiolinea sp.]